MSQNWETALSFSNFELSYILKYAPVALIIKLALSSLLKHPPLYHKFCSFETAISCTEKTILLRKDIYNPSAERKFP